MGVVISSIIHCPFWSFLFTLTPFQHGVYPTDCTLSGMACSTVGSQACGVTSPAGKSAPAWSSMGCIDSLCLHGVHQGLQGLFAAVPRAPPPSPPLTLVSAGLIFLCILTPFSGWSCAAFFSHLLKYIFSELLPLSPVGSASASSECTLESSVFGSVWHGGSFWQLLT